MDAKKNKTILLVEDDQDNLKSLEMILQDEGYRVLSAQGGLEALALLNKNSVDLVLTDLKMPLIDGMDLLKKIKKQDSKIWVLLMTAHGTIETAVEAIKHGAHDFIPKPFKKAHLLRVIEKCFEFQNLQDENLRLKSLIKQINSEKKFIGKSLASLNVLQMVEQAAPSNATILLEGESGTGKEVIAQMVHDLSARQDKPFVKVSCAALPESLLEAELFGFEKGAFTGATQRRIGRFEQADTGTLFLDEIGEISPTVAVKLLRVLQEGTIERLGSNTPIHLNVRIIAATNKNLEQAVKENAFRQDLYYRLNVINIKLPPLRIRQEDIKLLANHFIDLYNQKHQKQFELTEQAIKALTQYAWPGNVRELENTLAQAMTMTRDHVLDVGHFPIKITTQSNNLEQETLNFEVGTTLQEVEKRMILNTLKHTKGDKSLAAKLLGITERTIYRKLDEYK